MEVLVFVPLYVYTWFFMYIHVCQYVISTTHYGVDVSHMFAIMTTRYHQVEAMSASSIHNSKSRNMKLSINLDKYVQQHCMGILLDVYVLHFESSMLDFHSNDKLVMHLGVT